MTTISLRRPEGAAPSEETPCSAGRVRAFLAGELGGAEADAEAAHLAGCLRCEEVRSEVERERARLGEDLPFEEFARGIGERLGEGAGAGVGVGVGGGAGGGRRAGPRRAEAARRWSSFAAAAAVLVVVGWLGLAGLRTRWGGEEAPLPGGVRLKGGGGLALFVQRGSQVAEVRPGERVLAGDRLLPSLETGGRPFVLVALVEPGEVSVLYRGEARSGPLPGSFEWIGRERQARLVAIFADDFAAADLALAALRAGAAPDQGRVLVVERLLSR